MDNNVRFFLCISIAVLATADLNSSSIDSILQPLLGQPFALVSINGSISEPCRAHSEYYLHALKNYKQWALNMYDSSAKLQSGVLTGDVFNYGGFDQCLLVKPDEEKGFVGQHCTVNIKLSLSENCTLCNLVEDKKTFLTDILGDDAYGVLFNSIIAWGFCVPSSCSAKDLYEAAREKLKPLMSIGIVNVDITVKEHMCYSSQHAKSEFTAGDYGFLTLVIILTALIICGSFTDILFRKMESDVIRCTGMASVLTSFSVFKNGHELLTAKTNKNHVGCLNGIRFFSAVWVILGHKLIGSMLTTTKNWTSFMNGRFMWIRMFLHNAFVSTDTFLLVSGLVLYQSFMRSVLKTSTFNIPVFYLERYIRLTPFYAVVIFFHASWMYHMGSGPRWNFIMETERSNCIKNWWSNLLYVNNYVGVGNRMCVETGWYLAVDMQLYVLSPLLLLPLWRWPRRGLAALAILLSAAVAIPAAITAANQLTGLPSLALFKDTDFVRKTGKYYDYFNMLYAPTYTRMGPYLLGVGLGYLMHVARNKEIILSKLTVLAGWVASSFLMLIIIFGSRGMYLNLHPYDVVESTIYGGIHRTAWALAVAWVIFACDNGYGGAVNAILSSNGMAIMNQFTYSIYLCHWSYLLITYGMDKVPYYYSDFNNVREYVGDVMVIILIAIAMTLTVEMPTRNLCRILMSRGMRTLTSKKQLVKADQTHNGSQIVGSVVGPNTTRESEEIELSIVVNRITADSQEHLKPSDSPMSSARK